MLRLGFCYPKDKSSAHNTPPYFKDFGSQVQGEQQLPVFLNVEGMDQSQDKSFCGKLFSVFMVRGFRSSEHKKPMF